MTDRQSVQGRSVTSVIANIDEPSETIGDTETRAAREMLDCNG